MENDIATEARKFVNSLIKINRNKTVNGRTLDDLFNDLVDKKYKKHKIKILVHTTVYLAEENYELRNSDEFGLIDFN